MSPSNFTSPSWMVISVSMTTNLHRHSRLLSGEYGIREFVAVVRDGEVNIRLFALFGVEAGVEPIVMMD